MAVQPGPVPRAGPGYSQRWAQDVVQRLENVIRFLSGQIELDIPLIGLSGRRHYTVEVTAAAFTITPANHVIKVNRIGVVALTLGDGAGDGQAYRVIDTSGQAAANNITITPESGTINGAPSIVLNQNFEQCEILYDEATAGWLADKVIDKVIAVPVKTFTITPNVPTVTAV